MKRNVKKCSDNKFNYYLDLIKKFASDTYSQFYDNYIKIKNIKDKNYVLPNSILDYEDVIQDYYTKSYELLNEYFENERRGYIREYLIKNLLIYQQVYLDSLICKYSLEQKNNQIQEDAYYIKAMLKEIKQDRIRKQVLKKLLKNEKLKNYHTLIQEILSGSTYSEIYTSCGLNWHEVNIAIEEIGNIYQGKLEGIQRFFPKYEVSDKINKYNKKIDYYKKYLYDKVQEFYSIIYPYFLIDNYKLHTYFKDKVIEQDIKLRIFLEEPDKYLYILDQLINNTKSLYLKQYFNLNIDSIIFNTQFNKEYLDKEIVNKIKEGAIFEIPYYKKLLSESLKEIYQSIEKYDENLTKDNELYLEIYNYFKSTIGEIAQDFFQNNDNIDTFNQHLKNSLEIRKNNIIYQKLQNSKVKNRRK